MEGFVLFALIVLAVPFVLPIALWVALTGPARRIDAARRGARRPKQTVERLSNVVAQQRAEGGPAARVPAAAPAADTVRQPQAPPVPASAPPAAPAPVPQIARDEVSIPPSRPTPAAPSPPSTAPPVTEPAPPVVPPVPASTPGCRRLQPRRRPFSRRSLNRCRRRRCRRRRPCRRGPRYRRCPQASGLPPPTVLGPRNRPTGRDASPEPHSAKGDTPPPPPPPPQPEAPSFDWESLVGVKLFSAIAGIALVFAAVFFLQLLHRARLAAAARCAC